MWVCCCFFCVTRAQFATILYSCAARCVYGVVFQRSMPSGSVQSQLTNLSRIKEPRTDSP